jgi:hypothetical protein
MSDPQSESKEDVQFTFEPIAPPPPAKKGFLSKFGPIGLLLFFVFGKLKYLAVILQVGKFKTFITMLISIWAYAMFWGWPFAVGFVALLFIHEMGHVLSPLWAHLLV